MKKTLICLFVSYNIFGQGNNTPEFVKRTYPFINDFGNSEEVMKDIASYDYYGMFNRFAKEDSIARLGILHLRLRDFKVYPFVSRRPIYSSLRMPYRGPAEEYYQSFLKSVRGTWWLSIQKKMRKDTSIYKKRDSMYSALSPSIQKIFPPEDSVFIKEQIQYWRSHRRWDAAALKQYNIDIFTMDFTEKDKENKKKYLREKRKRYDHDSSDGYWSKASERFCNKLIAKDTTELGYEKMIYYSYHVIPYLSRPSLTKRASITRPIFSKNYEYGLITINYYYDHPKRPYEARYIMKRDKSTGKYVIFEGFVVESQDRFDLSDEIDPGYYYQYNEYDFWE